MFFERPYLSFRKDLHILNLYICNVCFLNFYLNLNMGNLRIHTRLNKKGQKQRFHTKTEDLQEAC